jgi:hypothetical protein
MQNSRPVNEVTKMDSPALRPGKELPVADDLEGLPLAALEPDECRWPVAAGADGKMRFCGEPVDKKAVGRFRCGVSYCGAHLKRAYLLKRPIAAQSNWVERLLDIAHGGAADRTCAPEFEGSGPRELEFERA